MIYPIVDGFLPLRIPKRAAQLSYAGLPSQCSPRRRVYQDDEEKYNIYEEGISTDESDYSEYEEDSPVSSRSTSGSYTSDRPLKGNRRAPIKKRRGLRIGSRIVKYLCYALISTIVIFVATLIRMSLTSSKDLHLAGMRQKGSGPPPLWESFDFLSRYYGGLKTLVAGQANAPEWPRQGNETVMYDEVMSENVFPESAPYTAYAGRARDAAGRQECFLDEAKRYRVPQLHYYNGRPNGFPKHAIGDYALLNMTEDICFDRYGRFGPYGYGYEIRNGGTGAGLHGDREGAEAVWQSSSQLEYIDYSKMNWSDAQKRCYDDNKARFDAKQTPVAAKDAESLDGVKSTNQTTTSQPTPGPKTARTAVVVRAWDTFVWHEEDILNLRAMIIELSLGSGAEYDVHLLVEVKNEAQHPIWADARAYRMHLKNCVPEEFQGIATMWSQTQMLMTYQGIHDDFAAGANNPVHGSYRGLQMPMQLFSQRHPDYDFYWQWELDARYSGHYYDLFQKIDAWAGEQPRKGLWERSSRYYIPEVHGTWDDFKHMVRVQSEMGVDGANNIWAGVGDSAKSVRQQRVDPPIWGPERPKSPLDWFEIEADPTPPHSYEHDKYEWGVGEAADLITLNPLFDPQGTTWLLTNDITGYDMDEALPRRAAIITASRMSRRLLTTMHRETAFKKHFAFSEMWAPTVALHHGYKAVYAPHPVFIDREWPVDYLASVLNAGRNGASGGARTSVFGEREHHFRGSTWYYNAGFAPNLWRRWWGFKVDNEGGEEFELTRNEGRNGLGVLGMRGGEGRMCLPPMLIHPVKDVLLPVEDEELNQYDEEFAHEIDSTE